MKYLIDTCIFFDLLKEQSVSHPIYQQRVMDGDQIVIFGLIRYEVLRGHYKTFFCKQSNEEQKKRERERIRKFEALVSTLDEFSDFKPNYIDHAASLYGETQATGLVGISDVDILLFTMARDEGCIVVSQDHHIKSLSLQYDVPFEDWSQVSSG